MHRHRLLTVAIAAATVAACAPSIEKHGNPESTDYVLLDPSTGQIPLPNDLALQNAAAQTGAQGELLQSFAAQGGFPNDQEVPITVDVQHDAYAADGTITKSPPPVPVDPATMVVNAPGGAATIALFEKKAGAAAPTPVDPSTVTVTYAPSSDKGTITIQNKPHAVTLSPGNVIQSRRWNAGSQYIVLLRGGASGVKVGGAPLTQQPTMYFLTRGVDLSKPENQYLLPGDGRQGRQQTGNQLEQLRQAYLPLFGLAERVFGPGASKDLLSAQTFQIAPQKAGGAVVTDASAGVVPFPSDLLLDPTTNKVVNNPSFGALATGLATLDGFSTTAMQLTQTSAPVVAATVNAGTVFLYDLSNPAQPVRVKGFDEVKGPGAGYVAEPYQLTRTATGTPCGPTDPATGCFSTAIGLQPAVPIPIAPTATPPRYLALPPLKEATEYAVLITDGVLVAGAPPTPLQGSTLGRILLFQNPLVDANGKSQVPGQSDATAAGLEKIRQGVAAAAAALQAEKGIPKSKIVLGYTVRTQSITQTALQLAAAPYQQASAIVPKAPKATYATLADAATAYGIPLPPSTTSNVAEALDVPVPTLDATSSTTGALEPDTTKWKPNLVTALVTVPNPALVTTACPGGSGVKCAPLVVFHHGLNGRRGNALLIAEALAAKGFAMAAIDAPYHGERGLCETGVAGECPSGTTCVKIPGSEGQGDATPIPGPPGRCTASDGTVVAPTLPAGKPQPYFVSGNLFRTRDALRQDVIDQSALVLALARPPAPTLPAVNSPIATALATSYGLAIDPSRVYWVGQSLGGIEGTLNLAVNPRFSSGVLNVDGGTIADIFTQSPAFAGPFGPDGSPAPTSPIGMLLASLNITYGTSQYLQFINVAKWVLDPAEPVNFAEHLVAGTLPDLLANKPTQSPKAILGQIALGDQVIPNQFNEELFGNVFGLLPTTGNSNVSIYGGTGVDHGFLLDYGNPAATVKAQSDAAAFLADPTALPPATQLSF